MEQGRKELLSMYYWIKDNIGLSNLVNVIREYKKGEDLVPPTVSIGYEDVTNLPFELGNEDGIDERFWAVEIYAESPAQRDDLAEIVYKNLKKVPVYNYDEGFVSPSRIGTLIVRNKRNTPIIVFEDLVEKIFWRRSITFTTNFEGI